MKKKYLITLPILAAVMFIAIGCEEKNDTHLRKTGYIMDYVMCCGLVHNETNDSAQAAGYYIISENLQDTLVSYNLSDFNINQFPADFFQHTENYRYSYKVEFEYENSDATIVCPTLYPCWQYPNATTVKIISIKRIKWN